MSSEATGADIDITVVADGRPPAIDLGLELAALADAMGNHPTDDPVAERDALVAAAGPEVAERAIGVAATFHMMNRLLDGVGAPVRPELHDIALQLGFAASDISR